MKASDVERRLEQLAATSEDPPVPYDVWSQVTTLDERSRARTRWMGPHRVPGGRVALVGLAAILAFAGGFAIAGGHVGPRPSAPVGVPSASPSTAPTAVPSDSNLANQVVFTVRGETAEWPASWRMIAYDQFSGTGWQLSTTSTAEIPAGQPLQAGTQDAPSSVGRTPRQFVVTLVDTSMHQLIFPNEAVSASVDTNVVRIGAGGQHTAYAMTDASTYTLTVLVTDPTSGGITIGRLRDAGTAYPAGLKELYTQGTDLVGQDGRALMDSILATMPAGQPVPYDVVNAVEQYLANPRNGFVYTTDITDLAQACAGLSTVDCFARTKKGFSQQYATTMTMLLRLQGIPARYVQGYLPGHVDPDTHVQTVTRAQQHAWVEVYFPGYGWMEFDPRLG